MHRKMSLLFVVTLVLSACMGGSGALPSPEPFDPAGVWDVTIMIEGLQVDGVLSVRGLEGGGLTGDIDTEMGAATITEVVLDGHTMTFLVPDVGATMELHFTGDEFMGGMSGYRGEGSINGIRRSPGEHPGR